MLKFSASPWQPSSPSAPLSQLPSVQPWPRLHALPQPPQFAVSVSVSMQVPSHEVCPSGQAQSPLTQTSPPPQALPQLPQFARLESVSTQVSPHRVCPSGQTQPP